MVWIKYEEHFKRTSITDCALWWLFIALEFVQRGGYKSRKLTHFLQIIIRK